MANFSSIKANLKNVQKNKIPSDVYDDDFFVYEVSNLSIGSISTLRQINELLANDQSNVSLVIKEVFKGKGKWSNDTEINISANISRKLKANLQIKNFNVEFDAKKFHIYSKIDLTEFVNDLGSVVEEVGVVFYRPTQNPTIGKDKTLDLFLESFNSYQFTSFATEEGNQTLIYKIIDLTFVPKQGVNVNSIEFEYSGNFLASKNQYAFFDENSQSIPFDIVTEDSDYFDIDHINVLIDSGTGDPIIISHTFTGLRYYDKLIQLSDGYIGQTPNINFTTPDGTPVSAYTNPNFVQLIPSTVDSQIELEFFPNSEYYTYFALDNPGGSDTTDFWKEESFTEIFPQSEVTNISMLKSRTGSVQTPNPPAQQNPNKQIEFWFSGDYKENFGNVVFSNVSHKFLLVKPKSLRVRNSTRAAEIINTFINGDVVNYKGLFMEPLPEILSSNIKNDFQDLDKDNVNDVKWYVVSSFQIDDVYISRRNFFDSILPVAYKQEFIHNLSGLYRRKKNWPLPANFQNLNYDGNFLFNDLETPKKVKIKFKDEAIVTVKEFLDTKIGGGSIFKYTQLDINGDLALDFEGNPIQPITRQNNWFLNKNRKLTTNNFVFTSLVNDAGQKINKFKRKGV